MPLTAIEGVVESGTIRLRENVMLPENTRVVVIIDGFGGLGSVPSARVRSPRLPHPERARDFRKQIVEMSADAGL
jgi:hypothetical protein